MKQWNRLIVVPLILGFSCSISMLAFLPGPQKKPVAPVPPSAPIPVPIKTVEQPLPIEIPSTIIQLQEFSIHPVWYFTNAKQTVGRKEKIDKFRTICDQLGATENPKIPAKTSDVCRIATYNVHFWANPYESWNSAKNIKDFNKMIRVIKTVDPDILVLQEVGGGIHSWKDEFHKTFKEMGFIQSACCSTSEHGVDTPGTIYNCIVSKYHFTKPAISKQFSINPNAPNNQNPERRCFLGATIQLPNNKIISIYGTHLEVRPIIVLDAQGNTQTLSPEAARKAQLQELITYINENDKDNNVIIGADFNEFRMHDLKQFTIANKTLWDILQEDWPNIVRAMELGLSPNLIPALNKQPSSLALDYLAEQGYQDSFTRSNVQPPQFTTWTGTRIDFLFLRSSWNLPLKGSYVFYDWASDHIPVIMDFSI